MAYPDIYLDIGPTFTYPFAEGYKGTIFYDKIITLLRELRFAPIFYDIKNYCLKELDLGQDYDAVHLRLEDDLIPYLKEEGLELLKDSYLSRMRELYKSQPDRKIFLATHLGKADYRNNSFLEVLQQEFPGVVFWSGKRSWRESFPEMILGREIDGIIDYLICRESKHFIGYFSSTFSETIYMAMESEGKSPEYIRGVASVKLPKICGGEY